MTSKRKRAIVSGITGQDGSYLKELLLEKGYEVHGLTRRVDRPDERARTEADQRLFYHAADLADGMRLLSLLQHIGPDEVYNLGAQSQVAQSFVQPEYTADIVGTGALRFLEAIRQFTLGTGHEVRYYQAGSSEMFGAAPAPQSETTPFHPRSPYAVAKVAAYHYAVNYREAYGMFVCNGILFNHESPRRGEMFVTRKITRAVGRIKLGLQDKLVLGNLESYRDWGYAGDFVQAMWAMLQQDEPDDYVIATGETRSVREFLEEAFNYAGLSIDKHVTIDKRHLRPTDVDRVCGDATRARAKLDWKATVSFAELVRMMVDHDVELARRERTLVDAGYDATARV